AKSHRSQRKEFVRSRSRSASIPIVMWTWCGGGAGPVGPASRRAAAPNTATPRPAARAPPTPPSGAARSSISARPSQGSEVAPAIDAAVMADESAWNAHDVIEIIDKRAAQIVSIYTTKPGGLYRALEVAAVARAAGLICNINGSAETGIGNLANLQLAAVAPCTVLSCVVPVSTP